jgi:hypothetical protein
MHRPPFSKDFQRYTKYSYDWQGKNAQKMGKSPKKSIFLFLTLQTVPQGQIEGSKAGLLPNRDGSKRRFEGFY